MQCVKCGSATVTERPECIAQGYRRFRCRACGEQFNERTDGLLNWAQYRSGIIALVVLWRLRYRRDLPEMFLNRRLVFSHEAVRAWEAKLTLALAEDLWGRRRSKVGRSWYVDETYLKVQGRWCYLYRAIDRSGALVDAMLSEYRDMAATKAFFRSAKAVTGVTPNWVTTDGDDSYPRAIRTELGCGVQHRTSRYLAPGAWIRGVLARRPARLATIALANKTARIIWALTARKESYRPHGHATAVATT